MARKARGTGAKEQELPILNALRFVKVAQKEQGKAAYQQHCRFTTDDAGNSVVIAFDGILTAGHPVVEPMSGCPHTFRLIDALERVRGAYSMVLLDNGSLAISSGAYRALVPCTTVAELEVTRPDAKAYNLDDRWKVAAVRAGAFSAEGATTVMGASVITHGSSLVGTNGMAMVEAFHGNAMPPSLIIPMAFVQAVAKVDPAITGFGYTGQESLTIYFDTGAWIKTQLYQEAYPDVNKYLATLDMRGCTDIPPGFFDAIAAVVPFSPVSNVVIDRDQIRSHDDNSLGAQHQCEGLPYDMLKFNGDYILKLKAYMTKMDMMTHANFMLMLGDTERALITKITR